jgi:hypothetical protein
VADREQATGPPVPPLLAIPTLPRVRSHDGACERRAITKGHRRQRGA